MGQLVADDTANRAIIVGRIRVRVEHRGLQDAGGEDDVAQRSVVGVVGLRGHAPVALVDRSLAALDIEVPVSRSGSADVADQVIAADDHVRIIPLGVRISDLDEVRVELLERFTPCCRAHPVEGCQSAAEGGLYIADERGDLGLGRCGEVALGIELADRPVERSEAASRIDAAVVAANRKLGALPSRRLFLRAGEGLLAEGKMRLVEWPRQIGCSIVGDAERHPCLHGVERGRGDDRRDLGKSGVGGDDESLAVRDPRALEIGLPRELRRKCL